MVFKTRLQVMSPTTSVQAILFIATGFSACSRYDNYKTSSLSQIITTPITLKAVIKLDIAHSPVV